MTADAFEILLLLRADGALLPVYRGALTQAQGWPWSIRRRYRGALLVARAGVARVAGIEVTGPVGDAVPARVFSVLNGDWRVAVRLEEAPMPFDAVRDAVMRSLRANDAAGRTPFDRPPPAECLAAVARVDSLVGLFAALGLDDPAFEALDVH